MSAAATSRRSRDSDLYLRYVIGLLDPETLHTTRERHIRCNPVLAQFIVDDDFPPVDGRGGVRQACARPAYVAEREPLVTRGYRRLRELAPWTCRSSTIRCPRCGPRAAKQDERASGHDDLDLRGCQSASIQPQLGAICSAAAATRPWTTTVSPSCGGQDVKRADQRRKDVTLDFAAQRRSETAIRPSAIRPRPRRPRRARRA